MRHREHGRREGEQRDGHERGARAETRENRAAAARPESPRRESVEARREIGRGVAQKRFRDRPKAEPIKKGEEPKADDERNEATRARVVGGEASGDLVDGCQNDKGDSDRETKAAPVEKNPEEDHDEEKQEQRRDELVDLPGDALRVEEPWRVGIEELTGDGEADVSALVKDEAFRRCAERGFERAHPDTDVRRREI